MLKMVDGTGIIGVDMVCPLGGTASSPQPPNYDKVEVEGVGSLMLPNSLKAPLERVELIGNSVQGENPSPDNPQEIKSAWKWNDGTQKYEVDVKVTGKNLLDIKDITSETPQWLEIPCLIKNNIYIKSNNSTVLVENNQARLTVCFKDGTSRAMYNNSMADGLPFKVNSENPITTIKVRGTHIKSGVYSDIQVEYGTTATPYEPYTEQSVQIALNEPLRGIGEYKDTITKDGVIRKIASYEFNLNDLRDGGYEKTNTVMFSVKVQNRTVGYASLKPSIFCNIFPDCALQTSNIYNTDKECIAVGVGIILFRVNKSRLKDTSTFESAKQSFIEFMVDKKMIVEYALETPITEPLPESVQAQLQALHSENGVTHVFVDSGEVEAGIKLTYRKEI